MTRDDIIRMAKEAGQADGTTPLERNFILYAAKSSLFLEKFAGLIAVAEREACAKVADGFIGADPIAAAIRARGEK